MQVFIDGRWRPRQDAKISAADGKIIARFDSKVKPDSEEVTKAIEAALAAK